MTSADYLMIAVFLLTNALVWAHGYATGRSAVARSASLREPLTTEEK